MPGNDEKVEEYFASFGVKGLTQTIAKLKEFQKQAQITFEKLSFSESGAVSSTSELNDSLGSLNSTMAVVSRSLSSVTAKTTAFARANRSAIASVGRGRISNIEQGAGETLGQALGASPRTPAAKEPRGPILTMPKMFTAFLGFEGAKKVFDVNTQYQAVVNGIMNVTHSASQAQAVMGQLQQSALKMHFNFLDLSKDFPRFALSISGAGGSMQDSLKMFQDMTIAIAGAHLPRWMAQRTMQDFINDIVNIPKVSGRLIRTEFGLSGFAGVLMKSLNLKSSEDLVKKLNSLNPAARAKLVSSTLAKAFSPGFEAFASTPQAALNDLQSTFQNLLVGFGKSGGLLAMVQVFKTLNEILGVARPLLIVIGIAFGAMAKVIGGVNDAIDSFTSLFPKDSEWGRWISFVTKLGLSLVVLSRSTKLVALSMSFLEAVTSPVLATILAITGAVGALTLAIEKLHTMSPVQRHDFIKNTGSSILHNIVSPFVTMFPEIGIPLIAGQHLFSAQAGTGASHTLNVHVNAGTDSGHEIADHVVRQVKAHYTNKGILQ